MILYFLTEDQGITKTKILKIVVPPDKCLYSSLSESKINHSSLKQQILGNSLPPAGSGAMTLCRPSG